MIRTPRSQRGDRVSENKIILTAVAWHVYVPTREDRVSENKII